MAFQDFDIVHVEKPLRKIMGLLRDDPVFRNDILYRVDPLLRVNVENMKKIIMSDFIYGHAEVFGITGHDVDNMRKCFSRDDHEYIPQIHKKFKDDVDPERKDWINEVNSNRTEYGFYELRPSGL